jgi:outer membrane protein
VVAQNELAVEQAKNNLDKSVTELAYSANFPLDKNYSVSGKEFSTDISYDLMEEYINSNSDLDRLVDKALRNRYDYRIAVKNIDLLKANLDIARSSVIFPTISGFSSYSLSGQKITNISNQRIFTVGLSLSYPIFQGFSLDNQRQQAELNLNSARADAELLKNQIALEIKKLIIDMKSLLKQIEITDRNIKNAQQDLLLAEESYRIGTGTVLEINTASVNLTNILINKSNLIYNFILAQKQLEYYQGLLTY